MGRKKDKDRVTTSINLDRKLVETMREKLEVNGMSDWINKALYEGATMRQELIQLREDNEVLRANLKKAMLFCDELKAEIKRLKGE